MHTNVYCTLHTCMCLIPCTADTFDWLNLFDYLRIQKSPIHLAFYFKMQAVIFISLGANVSKQHYLCESHGKLPGSEQILSPRRFCPPGHNLLAEIVPHGHNPLADIVPLPQILSPPPPPPPPPPFPGRPPTDAWPSRFFFVGFRSYKPRPLFASSQRVKFSTHTHTPSLPLPRPPSVPQCYQSTFPPDVLAAALNIVPSALLSCTWCALQLLLLWMKKSTMPFSAFWSMVLSYPSAWHHKDLKRAQVCGLCGR